MRSRATAASLVSSLVLTALVLCASGGRAQEVCEPVPTGPIFLYILKTNAKVQEFARSVRDATVLRRDASTVVFEDGRIITADVSAASRFIEELGWQKRNVRVALTFPRRVPRRRRAVG